MLAMAPARLSVRPSALLGLTDPWEVILLDVAVAVRAEEKAGERTEMLARVNPIMALLAMGGGSG